MSSKLLAKEAGKWFGGAYDESEKVIRQAMIGIFGKVILDGNYFTKDIIALYDKWIGKRLNKQIARLSRKFLDTDLIIRFGEVVVRSPSYAGNVLLPYQAKLKGLTYDIKILCHITIIEDGDLNDLSKGKVIEKTKEPVLICKIPCMTGSRYCHLYGQSAEKLRQLGEDPRDPLGYFIIEGKMKVVTMRESIAVDKLIFGKEKDTDIPELRLNTRIDSGTIITTLRISPYSGDKPPTKNLEYKRIIQIHLGGMHWSTAKGERKRRWINIFRAIRLLGLAYLEFYQDEKEDYQWTQDVYAIQARLLEFANREHYSTIKTGLADTIIDAMGSDTDLKIFRDKIVEQASDKEANQDRQFLEEMLNLFTNSVIPHITNNDKNDRLNKLYNLVLLCYYAVAYKQGLIQATDRNSWANKRINTASLFMEQVFRSQVKQIIKFNDIPKNDNIISSVTIEDNKITNKFATNFRGVRWVSNNSTNVKEDMVELLDNETFMKFLSTLTKTKIPTNSKSKNLKTRESGPSAAGYIDPSDTPENSQVGLIRIRAVTCQITKGSEPRQIIKFLSKKGLIAASRDEANQDKIMINALFVGWGNREGIKRAILEGRRNTRIDPYVSVYLDHFLNFIYISTNEGRVTRPLMIVNDEGYLIPEQPDKTHLWTTDYRNLFRQGVLDWLDAQEQEQNRVAYSIDSLQQWREDYARALAEQDQDLIKYLRRNKYTYCEIHPQARYSPSVGIMPFIGMTQAPRITFQASMSKQSLGRKVTEEFAKTFKELNFPAPGLVRNPVSNVYREEEYAAGVNLVIALSVYEGLTQEDGTVLNRSTVEKGYLDTIKYFTITVELDNKYESFGVIYPAESDPDERWKYRYLTRQGFPAIGAKLEPDDYIVGKIRTKVNDNGNREKTPIPQPMMSGQYGIVEKIYLQGKNKVIILLRENRPTATGNKVAAMYAQKGIVGQLVSPEDLPFSERDGLVPDMIVNPHSNFRRMTPGYLFESLFGMVAAITGKTINSGPFEKYRLEDFYRVLRDFGYSDRGYHWMVDPHTGRRHKTMIFMGPAHIQILRHQIGDKYKKRSYGIVDSLKRQPPKSRKLDGGVKIGPMEHGCTMSHQATNVAQDLYRDNSNSLVTEYCKKHGQMLDSKDRCGLCANEEEETESVKVKTSYTYKIISKTLFGMGIELRLANEEEVKEGRRLELPASNNDITELYELMAKDDNDDDEELFSDKEDYFSDKEDY